MMPGRDDEDAGRRGRGGYRGARRRRGAHDTARLAARLAPPEEKIQGRAGRNGDGPDDTIRVEADGPNPSGGLLGGGDDERGVFYMPPVVTVAVSLFLAYTLFVAALIALG